MGPLTCSRLLGGELHIAKPSHYISGSNLSLIALLKFYLLHSVILTTEAKISCAKNMCLCMFNWTTQESVSPFCHIFEENYTFFMMQPIDWGT